LFFFSRGSHHKLPCAASRCVPCVNRFFSFTRL
jgi:hypothetical protein